MSEEREEFAAIHSPNGETRVVPVVLVLRDDGGWTIEFPDPALVRPGEVIEFAIPRPT